MTSRTSGTSTRIGCQEKQTSGTWPRPGPKDEATQRRMRSQRRKDTEPELAVRKALSQLGVRYRLHNALLPAKPDIVNQVRRWAILVHGCYWHHHSGCADASMPIHNASWWRRKFEENRLRDNRKIAALQLAGFAVLVVWECETKDHQLLVKRLGRWLQNMRIR
jgi:DNA mismatch endonuclease (patch repair protein)